ncbi:hypothetical protein [Wenyingzhuangia aestuarii]|uniref:hypothetical protein n=1 Tax=Wenyingzhuangia aestuarii TaxID=1647582 RepID=UPI00143A39F4|nr:hypothetical protein [Wenyingzhuangia aestuarii]NJB82060.1 hypothetical protein [Wenyingzhuangia aestuarii]
MKKNLIILCFVFVACKQTKQKKEVQYEKPVSEELQFSIGDDKVKISLPKDIHELSTEKIELKYTYEPRRPSKMFLKESDSSYVFNLNYKVDKKNNTLGKIQKLYTKLYKSREIKLLSNEIKRINGKEFLCMKMLMPPQSVNTSPVDEISHFFVTFTDAKILIASIRYPLSKDDKYSSEALACLNSISFE